MSFPDIVIMFTGIASIKLERLCQIEPFVTGMQELKESLEEICIRLNNEQNVLWHG